MFQSFLSPSSWLEEDDDPVVAKVNQRMQQITGLTVKTAELLQVGALVRLHPGKELLVRVLWCLWRCKQRLALIPSLLGVLLSAD